MVILVNNHSDVYHKIKIGDRIGQIVLIKKYDVEFEQVNNPAIWGETTGGENGFESTGI